MNLKLVFCRHLQRLWRIPYWLAPLSLWGEGVGERGMRRAAAGLLLMLFGLCGSAVAQVDPELIKRGEYLARVGDCVACHTEPGGKPFAGGLKLPTPIGDVIATNITPSKTAGIGNYTLEQFDAAVRRGIRGDGKYLYPAMPYTSYIKVSDEDIEAMYAYFMNAVEPVDTRPPETQLPFPFNIRLAMAVWNTLFLDETPFQPDPSQSDEWNRGAYLVQGLTHCSTCHSPRNMFMAEDRSRDLAGGEVGPWYAPNITSDPVSGVGDWSIEEIVQYMKQGSIPKSQAAGPMAEAIDHSFQYMTDADLRAMAVYLKSMPAVAEKGVEKPVHTWGQAGADFVSFRGVPWPENPDEMNGPQLFDAYCAACHQAQGQGTPGGGMPALYRNTATGRLQANNLVMVILEGIHRVSKGYEIRMPGFANELSDQQIATLSNYLTEVYGNPQAEISSDQVGQLREGQVTSTNLVLLARIGMAVGALVVLLLIVWLIRRLRRT